MSGGFDPLVPRESTGRRRAARRRRADGEVAALLDDAKIFAAPDDPRRLARWREQLAAWRADARGAPRRSGAAYDDPDAAWASRCFTVAQVWLWDELLYDFDRQRFTPERFLADARERFGGLDGVVLWHAYPVIGIDDRNQWDFYRRARAAARRRPRSATRACAVFVDYNPWDTGTRRGGDDVDELAAVDPRARRRRRLPRHPEEGRPRASSPRSTARARASCSRASRSSPTERIADHALSWAQWFADSTPPGVLRAHWFERRHMQHHIRRWHRDHSDELHSAWLNGVGRDGLGGRVRRRGSGGTTRDAATLRRMLPVQRRLHRWLVEGDWTPLAGVRGVAASSAREFALEGTTLTRAREHVRATRSCTGRRARARGSACTTDAARAVTGDAPPAVGGARAGRRRRAAPVARWRRGPDGLAELRAELAGQGTCRDASFPHRRARRLAPPAGAGRPRTPDARARLRAGAVVLEPGEQVRHRAVPPARDRNVRRRARTSTSGSRCRRACTTSGRWSASSTLPARAPRRRPRGVATAEYAAFLAATGEPPSPTAAVAATMPRPTGVTFARRPRVRRVGRRAAADRGRVAARRAEPGFARREPVVWNWTESEHSDGRTRFVMLKGGARPRRRRARTGTSTAGRSSRSSPRSCCCRDSGSTRRRPSGSGCAGRMTA